MNARERTPDHHAYASTSSNNPLRIASVTTLDGGRIGMTLCPGKVGPGRHHIWDRSLKADLEVIRAWGACTIITLMEPHELIRHGVKDMDQEVRALLGRHGWFHLPIMDMHIPDMAFEAYWRGVAPVFHRWLEAGERILVHCLGGLGRTGTIACRLLVESGIPPQEALELVRVARPGAVETPVQERYVLSLLENDGVLEIVNSRPVVARRLAERLGRREN